MKLLASIDQGTSSSRVILFDENGHQVGVSQHAYDLITPQPGWCELKASEVLDTVRQCMQEAAERAPKDSEIVSIGITNQRETCLLWRRSTGEALHNALVWLDTRTAALVDQYTAKSEKKADALRSRCGLPLATYFSALKLRWLLDNCEAARHAVEEGDCMFGTIDSWLIWNLSGGAANNGMHVTDVTNASRTMLMNIETCEWDSECKAFFDIPDKLLLPEIRSSAEVYANVADGPMKGVPIAGCLGDQQAALVGQQCFDSGEAKNTYGTGCFMLLNTGANAVISTNGLLTTVAYRLGSDAETTYALEGSIAIAGAGIKWMIENMGAAANVDEFNTLASSVDDTGDVYFVPAFSGLFAPYWRQDARGVIVGLTQYSTRAHMCRAMLESVCFQTREVLDAMHADSGVQLQALKVDGGMTNSELLLQTQADLLDRNVVRASNPECTALGAAIAAGLAVRLFSSIADVKKKMTPTDSAEARCVCPSESRTSSAKRLARWRAAVERSYGWAAE